MLAAGEEMPAACREVYCTVQEYLLMIIRFDLTYSFFFTYTK